MGVESGGMECEEGQGGQACVALPPHLALPCLCSLECLLEHSEQPLLFRCVLSPPARWAMSVTISSPALSLSSAGCAVLCVIMLQKWCGCSRKGKEGAREHGGRQRRVNRPVLCSQMMGTWRDVLGSCDLRPCSIPTRTASSRLRLTTLSPLPHH